MRTLGLAALFWISSSLFACEHGDTSHQALTPASGTTPSAERAAEQVTRARCDRAERCGEIDRQALFTSRQHCLDQLWRESVAQLSPCRTGVDDDAVKQCLNEIRQHGCDDAMGGFEQYLACKVDDLCI
jgi:hypothetical protein